MYGTKMVSAAAVVAAAFVLPACSNHVSHVSGHPHRAASHTTSRVTDTTTTATTTPAKAPRTRDDQPDAAVDWRIDFDETPSMSVDRLFRMAVSHTGAFWSQEYGVTVNFSTKPEVSCPSDNGSEGPTPAASCGVHSGADVIGYDSTLLTKERAGDNPDVSVVIIAAHEVGHAIGDMQGYDPAATGAFERSADCFAGTYMKGLGVPAKVAGAAFGHTVADQQDHDARSHAFADGYTSSTPLSTCTSY